MTSVSISQLKARLSAFLDIVRGGEEVVVTDRGRAIARLIPASGAELEGGRRELLIRTGRIRPPLEPLPDAFWSTARPTDPEGRSITALLEERSARF